MRPDQTFDYSTIDTAALTERSRPITLGPGCRASDHYGSRCYLDAPGYPSYFVRHVYSASGNEPRSGSTVILMGREIEAVDTPYNPDARAELYRAIYRPLPFEHARVQAWIAKTFQHFRRCYRDAKPDKYGRPGMLIYPYSDHDRALQVIDAHILDKPEDPRWSDTYRAELMAKRAAVIDAEETRAAAIAIPENYLAVRAVREIYPDQAPAALMARYVTGDKYGPGDWWEREAARPASPEACRPYEGYVVPGHRAGWCQYCGYVTESTPAGVR